MEQKPMIDFESDPDDDGYYENEWDVDSDSDEEEDIDLPVESLKVRNQEVKEIHVADKASQISNDKIQQSTGNPLFFSKTLYEMLISNWRYLPKPSTSTMATPVECEEHLKYFLPSHNHELSKDLKELLISTEENKLWKIVQVCSHVVSVIKKEKIDSVENMQNIVKFKTSFLQLISLVLQRNHELYERFFSLSLKHNKPFDTLNSIGEIMDKWNYRTLTSKVPYLIFFKASITYKRLKALKDDIIPSLNKTPLKQAISEERKIEQHKKYLLCKRLLKYTFGVDKDLPISLFDPHMAELPFNLSKILVSGRKFTFIKNELAKIRLYPSDLYQQEEWRSLVRHHNLQLSLETVLSDDFFYDEAEHYLDRYYERSAHTTVSKKRSSAMDDIAIVSSEVPQTLSQEDEPPTKKIRLSEDPPV
ncbi:hypothetical protein ElyMa_004967700 [Elysia marginata]|uniref:Ras-GEF domain-containing protein n=1 Tax=Elysia marginata TaxID=1093978 RepID=A0AAV4J3P4_9GAST|nr:hypothetical protein ElyMa_004967700 [Elysia marginata]